MKMAVTGVGIVSPLGNNVPDNIQNLKDMVVPLADARIKDDPIASPLMKLEKIFHANYNDLNIDDLVPDRDQRYSDPICTTSLIACDEAVKMSGITLPYDTPVFVGSIQGGCISELDWVSDIINGRKKIHPKVLLNSAQEYVSNVISEHFKIHGPASVIAATCISGVQALQTAEKYLETGTDCAIVGATDFMTSSTTLYYFQALGAHSKTPKSVPWDKDRDGIIPGEGSVYLIVEPLEKAQKRGANIRWVIDGIGIASDAHHPTQPDPAGTGGKIAIEQAMKHAGTTVDDYNVINAHATGTPVGDPIEHDVLKEYFNKDSWLYSNKGQVGHMMGASCLIELVLGAEAMNENFIPGNAGLVEPFDNTHFSFTYDSKQHFEYNRLMKTSFGFGGRSSAVSVSKYEK
jgi:3-oxoacyl-[acyl-carrier-protein] synthase II